MDGDEADKFGDDPLSQGADDFDGPDGEEADNFGDDPLSLGADEFNGPDTYDDEEQPEQPTGRDPKGRWLKGQSGNTRGRPRQRPPVDLGDAYYFGSQPVKVEIQGENKWMTRRAVVNLKLYENAMKGRISAQKYLHKLFLGGIEEQQMLDFEIRSMNERLRRAKPNSVTDRELMLADMLVSTIRGRARAVQQLYTEAGRKKRR